MRVQPSSFKYLKRGRQQNSGGREVFWERLGRLYVFLECNTDHICMRLNEASPASTSQPGSGSGVPLVQVLASKSPLWIFVCLFVCLIFPSLFSLSGKRCTTLAACHAHVCLPLHPRLPLFPISLGNSTENN